MKLHRLLGGAAAAALILSTDILMSVPAVAQIDEIIVTARKREESLQSVPLSVTAFSTEQISQINPRSIQDLDGFSPNVFIGQQTAVPGGGAIYIRSEGYSDVEKTQNPSVGLILDDVFLGTNTGQLVDAFDLQSLEINRGPQGVLFGKNTTGGVLRAERSRPTGELGVRASFGYGSDEQHRFRIVGNAPIIKDILALKLGGTINSREGYTTNVFTGTDEGFVDYKAATAELLLTPGVEGLEILFGFDWIEDRSGLLPVEIISDGDDPFESHADFGNDSQYDLKLYRAKIEYESPKFGTFTSVTAVLDTSDRAFQDFDATNWADPTAPQNGVFGAAALGGLIGFQLHTDRLQEYDQITQEFRWNRKFFDDRVDLLLGGYYYKHEVTLTQLSDSFNDGLGCGLVGFVPTACFALTGGLGTAAGFDVFQNSGEENRAFSGFASIFVDITDKLTISAGLRHIHEEKDQFTGFDNLLTPGFDTPVPDSSDSWNYTTPKVGLDYQVTEDLLFYMFYAQGFRSGGISIRGVPDPIAGIGPDELTYDPEIVKTFEFGIKSQWFNDRLRVNMSGFFSNREDSQSNIVTFRPPGSFPATNTVILNAQEVGVHGFELEMLANPLEGLNLGLTYGYIHGSAQESLLPLALVGPGCPKPDPVAGLCDGSGAGLTRSPENQIGANVSYTRPLGIGEINVNANYIYRSDFEFIGGFTTTFVSNRESEYHVVNGGIAYNFELNGIGLGASFTGKNILDERYRAAALPQIDFQSWEAPRTWLFEVQMAY